MAEKAEGLDTGAAASAAGVEAAKQFAQAATLDLTAAEKAELAGMNRG